MEPNELPLDPLPTRRSLLSRLRSWDDHDSWRDFFDTYWRLIFDVARKAGLDEAAAQDVVQDTILSVSKEMPGFRYDRARGSFKAWLRQLTRRRIADQWRKYYRRNGPIGGNADDPDGTGEIGALATATDNSWEALWDAEWTEHVMRTALERVRREVTALQYQMFELYGVRGLPVGTVATALGTSKMQVYLAKHRVGALLRKELERVRREESH